VTGSTVESAHALPAATGGSLNRIIASSVGAGGLLGLVQSLTGPLNAAGAAAPAAAPGGGSSPAPGPVPGPGPGQGGLSGGSSGAGGVGLGGYMALIVLFALTMPALRRRMVLSPAGLGPAGFLSLLERPG